MERKMNKLENSHKLNRENGIEFEINECTFKPCVNMLSHSITSSLKPLCERQSELILKRQKDIENKRNEQEKLQLAECSFKPFILNKQSTIHFSKMGRSKTSPQDFLRYHENIFYRNNIRKESLDKKESNDLTFKPQLNLKSHEIIEKLNLSNEISVRKLSEQLNGLIEGNPLMLESDHPYKPNLDEYITIDVSSAVQYMVSFDEKTSTKSVYDYIRFYQNESHHENVWGSNKYSGNLKKAIGQVNSITRLV